MNLKKNRLAIPFLVLFSVITVASPANAAPQKLKVGFIAALSGSAQSYGVAARNGFEMALQEAGGDLVNVIYEDDQFSPSKTVSAFNKLVNLDSINVAVCVGSATCKAIAPLAQTRGIPLFGWASDRGVSLNRSLVMRLCPSGENEGEQAVKLGLARRFSKIAVVSTIHDYSQSWRDGAVAALQSKNQSAVLEEQVPPDMKDFRALLSKARTRGVQDMLVCMLPGQPGLFAKQAREMGMKGKIGGCEFLSDESELRISGGALASAWYISVEISPEFRSKYVAQFKNENTIAGAAVNYDLATLLHKVATMNVGPSEITSKLLELHPQIGAAGALSLRSVAGDQYFDYPLVAKEIR